MEDNEKENPTEEENVDVNPSVDQQSDETTPVDKAADAEATEEAAPTTEEEPVEGEEKVATEEAATPVAKEETAEEGTKTEEAAAPVAKEGTEEAEAEDAIAVATEKVEAKVINNRRWYSLRVISGKERKIKDRIEQEISRNGWKDVVTQILVPTQKMYKIRNSKKVVLERNILPGYILVEADSKHFRGEMISAIANIPNVIHFLGKNNPIPMQQSEANRMLGKVDESQNIGEALIEPFIVGETVKIIDGPFNEFVGDIQEVNEEKKKLKVIVKIFGRGTEVELNFMQVEKQA